MSNRNMENLFAGLAKSKFRSRFKLGKKEEQYLKTKGFQIIEQHARDFIKERIASEFPENDGKQTPMRNHPVFIAQHATATCCRKCLEKWHNIKTGQQLNEQEIEYVVSVIMYWLHNNSEIKKSSI